MLDTLGRDYATPKTPEATITGTARELEVLQFYARAPLTPNHYTDTLLAAAPTSYAAEIRAELFKCGYVFKWRKPYRTPRVPNSNKRTIPRDCLALTPKGYAFLRAKRPTMPFIHPTETFHQHYSSLIAAQFMYASTVIEGLTFEPTEVKIAHLSCPPDATKIKTHHHVFGTYPKALYADAPFFGLRYGKRHISFQGFEADRATESVNSEKTNSIKNKYRREQAYLMADANFTRYGVKNVYFPYITTSVDHMNFLIQIAKETIDKKFQKHFLFATMDDCADTIDYPPLTAHLVTDPWHTTTGLLSITETLGVPNGRDTGPHQRTESPEAGN